MHRKSDHLPTTVLISGFRGKESNVVLPMTYFVDKSLYISLDLVPIRLKPP